MKKRISCIAVLVSVLMVFSGCGLFKSEGASSPEALFKELKQMDRSQYSERLDLVVPEERPLLAFSLDFVAAFATAFSKDKALKDEYKAIRDKYGLKDMSKSKVRINMNDRDKLIKYANDTYGNIDLNGFLKDMTAFIKKLPGKSKIDKSNYKELKDLKVKEDTATATAVLENGKTEKLSFKKVDGRWYLSTKGTM